MAKKTYRTYTLKGLQLLLFDEYGRTIEVNFRGGVQIDSTAKYSTYDEKVQEALEACIGFNRDFYLESVREDKAAPAAAKVAEEPKVAAAPEAVEETVAEDGIRTVKVADKSEAIEWLKENYPEMEYTSVKLRSKTAFDAACKDCGVAFEMTE